MPRYIIGRLAQGAVVLFGAITLSFLLTSVSGNVARTVAGGSFATPEQVRAAELRLGLDEPLLARFGQYLADIAHGDFGESYTYHQSTLSLVLDALPYTLLLAGGALALALAIALPLSIASVLRRDSRFDHLVRVLVTVTQGMPDFWLALMLVLMFSIKLSVFPAVGFAGMRSAVLPVLALALPLVPVLLRLLRGQLLDVLGMDYVEALRAKGLSEREIVIRHGLRNILVPSIAFLALQAGWLLGGTILIEAVFAWPGLGSLMLNAVSARDLFVVQAVVVVVALGFVLLNLAADIIALRLDPRIRVGRS